MTNYCQETGVASQLIPWLNCDELTHVSNNWLNTVINNINLKTKLNFDVQYQALKTVFHHISKHPEIHLKYSAAHHNFPLCCPNLEMWLNVVSYI